MKPLTNFHAHSIFDDGSESCKAMVEAAISKGCVVFGISGHAPMDFATDWCMTRENEPLFIDEMRCLKEKYAGRLTLFTGVERDYYAPEPPDAYDYVIGSVHYINKDGAMLSVDDTEAAQIEAVRRFFGGDFYAYTRAYYETIADIVQKTAPDFIGHFDLVTKFNEGGKLFDETDPRYLNPALEALTSITETHKLFEINTGAMYRVGRTVPYPSPNLLKALRARGGEIILSSDSHDGASIGYKFDEMAELAKSCGFTSAKTLAENGFIEYKL
jgi:histidinol-phosphatase (PHP family)